MLCAIFFLAWKTMPNSPHALTWSILYFLTFINYLLNAGRDYFPSREFYWLLVNAVTLAIQALALIGFRQRAQLPPLPKCLLFYFLSIEILIYWFTYVDHHMGLRMAFTPFSATIILSTCAWVISLSREKLRAAEIATIVIFLIYALVQCAAGVSALMQGPESQTKYLELYRQINFIAAPPLYAGTGLFTVFILADDLSSKMKKLATTDQLTKVMNRRGFDEASLRAFAQAKREQQTLTLVLADIDFFKKVNDKYGHQTGDQVLCQFAELFLHSIRQQDLLGRLGGEEFAALLIHSNLAQSMETIERLRNIIEKKTIHDGKYQLNITCSFGLYELNLPQDSLQSAIRKADAALYQAKEAGRNCIKAHQIN